MEKAESAVDAVVGHHMNPFRSGVARFNEMLAERLGVPLVGLTVGAEVQRPLLSFKAAELDDDGHDALRALMSRVERWSLFLHDHAGLAIEDELVRGADAVWCANHEIVASIEGMSDRASVLFAPGLVSDLRPFEPASISVFSFGMAHKLRTDMFRRLRQLLVESGKSWALYVSTANHETATMRDAELVYEEMHSIFPERLYFLGNLSDVAVYNHLLTTTFFAAFFRGGVRANNTSIASAMEQGAVVITNLDEHSPPDLTHMDNVIDIHRTTALPSDPIELRRMSVRATETARKRSWAALVSRVLAGPRQDGD